MKKFIAVCAIVAAVIAARSVVAAERIADAGFQLVTDVHAAPADTSKATTSTAVDPGYEAGCAALPCDCCEVPRIVASVNVLFMQRQRPSDVVIFTNPGGATLLNASDFNFDYRPGIDASLIYNLNCRWGVDVRYLWLDEARDDVTFAFPTGTNHTNTTPPSFFSGGAAGGSSDFRYQSQLQTVEFNFRRHFQWFDALVG